VYTCGIESLFEYQNTICGPQLVHNRFMRMMCAHYKFAFTNLYFFGVFDM